MEYVINLVVAATIVAGGSIIGMGIIFMIFKTYEFVLNIRYEYETNEINKEYDKMFTTKDTEMVDIDIDSFNFNNITNNEINEIIEILAQQNPHLIDLTDPICSRDVIEERE